MLDLIREHWLFLLIGAYPKGPLGGLVMTLIITALGLVLSFPCAIAVALCRTSGKRYLVAPTTAFVYTVRGIPLLLLVFWIFFAVPGITGLKVDAFTTIVVAIVMFQSAYLSEVIRSGIEGLPKGQIEAAHSLGLRYWPRTFKIVLPQALYNVLPGILNNLTAIFKESSLAYVISLHELTYAALQVMNHEMSKPFQIFILLAGIYFACAYSLSYTARLLERRIERKRARDAGAAPIVIRQELLA